MDNVEPPPHYQQSDVSSYVTPTTTRTVQPQIVNGQYVTTTTTTIQGINGRPQITISRRSYWMTQQQLNKPQSRSLFAPMFVCFSAGLKIAWSMFSTSVESRPISLNIAWFVAAIIGTILAVAIVNRTKKKYIIAFSTLLTIGGGIILCSSDQLPAVEAAMYLDGLGFGLVILSAIILGGEIAVKYNRSILVTLPFFVNFGIFIQSLYIEVWYVEYSNFSPLQLQGIFSVVFGVLGLVSCIATIDSPLYFLMKYDESEAVRHIKMLRSNILPNEEIKQTLNEHRAFIEDDKSRTLSHNLLVSLAPLIKLSLLNGVSALTFCYAMTLTFDWSSSFGFGSPWSTSEWAPYIFVLLRWLGNFVGMVLPMQKKNVIVLAYSVSAILMVVVGGLCYYRDIDGYQSAAEAAGSLLIIQQLFAGMVEPMAIIYLSEAFTLHVKAFCIAVANIVSYLVQIICLVTILQGSFTLSTAPIFLFVTAALQYLVVVMSFFGLPNTFDKSLLVCRKMMSCWIWKSNSNNVN